MSKIFRVTLWIIIGLCLPWSLLNLAVTFFVAPLPGLVLSLIHI